MTKNNHITKDNLTRSVVLVLLLFAIVSIGTKNYLLFHTLVEMFSVLIAYGITLITLNTLRENNNFLLFLGIAYGFVGTFDLLHALAYNGMGVFPVNTANTG